ncbi:MAG: penicillin-binding transpeptidase domain-containing protein [Porticoccaceae bacterium]
MDLNQQALLIGMINAPSLYNPLRNPQNAKQRRDLVLRVMQQEKVISEQEASRAMAASLELNNQRQPGNSFPGYLDLVRRQLRQEYREEDLNSLGLSIFTNFDPILQRQLELSTSTVMDRLDSEDTLQSASIVTRIDTGEVVAIVGGRNVRYAGFNRALDARRPAGSLLKPAVYLAALEQPERYTLATPLLDEPLMVDLPNGDTWEPQNFGRESHGQVLLHRALAMSYNQASARLGLDLGIDRVVDMLYRLGVEGSIPEVPALSLGAGEYSPMDMTAMYQSIATGGFRTPLRSIRDIVDAQGNPLRRYPLEYDRSVNLQAMHLLHYALQEAVREGTGKGVYNYLEEDFAVAGKTGTTNNGRDSWFAGFSGDLLSVNWIGRDDNGSTGLTGGTESPSHLGALYVEK